MRRSARRKRAGAPRRRRNGCSSGPRIPSCWPRSGACARMPSCGARRESYFEASLWFEETRAAHLELARLAERTGREADAQSHFRRAAELSAPRPSPWERGSSGRARLRGCRGRDASRSATLPAAAATQDRLGAPAGLQPEQRAAVVDQIELDVAAAAIRLEFPLALAVGQRPPPFDDRRVGGEEVVADRLRQCERELEVALGKIIEEDSADAARLGAVLGIEILVAPFLEARMVPAAEGLEGALAGGVEVARVLLEAVVGGDPCRRRTTIPALRPRGWRAGSARSCARRAVGVARVQDERHAHRLEAASGELRSRCARRGRQARPLEPAKSSRRPA